MRARHQNATCHNIYIRALQTYISSTQPFRVGSSARLSLHITSNCNAGQLDTPLTLTLLGNLFQHKQQICQPRDGANKAAKRFVLHSTTARPTHQATDAFQKQCIVVCKRARARVCACIAAAVRTLLRSCDTVWKETPIKASTWSPSADSAVPPSRAITAYQRRQRHGTVTTSVCEVTLVWVGNQSSIRTSRSDLMVI